MFIWGIFYEEGAFFGGKVNYCSFESRQGLAGCLPNNRYPL